MDKCKHCKLGDFEFKKNSYICNGKFVLIFFNYFSLELLLGNISEWAMCENQVKKPRRHVPVLPKHWKNEWAEWNYEPVVQNRAIRLLVLKFDWTKEVVSNCLTLIELINM